MCCGVQAQKAREKEEDQDLKEKLDKEFESLARSQALLSLVRPKKVNALKAMVLKHSGADTENGKSIKAGDLSVPSQVLKLGRILHLQRACCVRWYFQPTTMM